MVDVALVHRNPSRMSGKLGKLLAPICGHIDDFGDLLGLEIVRMMALRSGVNIGPLTAQWLRDRGAHVPDVYGDPGLLASTLWPEVERRIVTRDYTIVPDSHDVARYRGRSNTISPRRSFSDVRARILASDFVVGSSLPAIVLAESYGIPARLIRSETAPAFAYEDYYFGSGRSEFRVADSVCQALRLGGEKPPEWDARALMDAFPVDLWASSSGLLNQ